MRIGCPFEKVPYFFFKKRGRNPSHSLITVGDHRININPFSQSYDGNPIVTTSPASNFAASGDGTSDSVSGFISII